MLEVCGSGTAQHGAEVLEGPGQEVTLLGTGKRREGIDCFLTQHLII